MSFRPASLLPIAALAVGLLTLSACRDNNDNTAGRDAASGTAPLADTDGRDATPPAPTGAALGEAPDAMANAPAQAGGERAALGVLNAINEHEIAAARQALDKNVQGDVAAYAQQMIDEHTRNREQTAALQPDMQAPAARQQAAKGEQKREQLAGRDGDAFGRAYIDAMVTDHQEALAALDNQLIPAAQSPEVAAHLRQTREHVAHHLERARELQGNR
jgi:putative membrane protein